MYKRELVSTVMFKTLYEITEGLLTWTAYIRSSRVVLRVIWTRGERASCLRPFKANFIPVSRGYLITSTVNEFFVIS